MTDDDRRDDDATDGPDLWIARRHADPDAPLVPADEHERRVVAALDRTRADLADHAARTPAMPASLAADLARALANESVADRRRRPRALVVAAAVVVLVVGALVGVLVVNGGDPAPREQAGGPTSTLGAPPPPDAPVLRAGDAPSALRAGLGRADYGPLADPARLADCLAAHGVPAGVRPVGAREVVVDGAPGVALVLPTGVAARFRVLVVGPGCARTTPLTVSDTLVGR